MIHNIAIQWNPNDLGIDFNLEDVCGDTVVINVVVEGVDLSTYKIRAELTDGGRRLQYGNTLVGGDSIEIVDSESGTSAFQLVVPAGDTTSFLRYGRLEIEVEDADGLVFTILQQTIRFLDQDIDWTIPA